MTTDPLTGATDRATLIDALERALDAAAPDAPVVVVGLDIDRFGILNAEQGLAIGDAVLAGVAHRIRAALRDDDAVGRVSADQFVALAHLADDESAATLAERLRTEAERPTLVDGREVAVSVSAAVARLGAAIDVAELLADLDAALDVARRAGGGTVVTADPRRRKRASERRALELEIAELAARDELVVHYQPCVDLLDGSLRGAEALVRWNHPERGLLGPEHFVEVAEDAGLIEAIDAWVLEAACGQLAEWQGAGAPDDVHVSVNVSARRFADPELVVATERAIERHGVRPGSLWLELTETGAVDDDANVTSIRDGLHAAGVQLMLDDVGTGFASFAALQRFGVDHLKVDRTFTVGIGADPVAEAIVEAILLVAQRLGLGVVAEGVATDAQVAWLLDHGCRLAQGERFGTPGPAGRLTF